MTKFTGGPKGSTSLAKMAKPQWNLFSSRRVGVTKVAPRCSMILEPLFIPQAVSYLVEHTKEGEKYVLKKIPFQV